MVGLAHHAPHSFANARQVIDRAVSRFLTRKLARHDDRALADPVTLSKLERAAVKRLVIVNP
jgi:hypothetical protein